MSSSSVAALPASSPGSSCARPVWSASASSTRPVAWGEPGTGTATRASCATSSPTSTSRCSKSSTTSPHGAMPPARRSSVTSRRSPTGTTSTTTPSSTRGCCAPSGTTNWRGGASSTDRGDRVDCRWYVLAVGILNLLKLPDIEGMEDFAGSSFHTARWDYDYTGGGPDEPLDRLSDKVVALVGTGASGLQCVPDLAASAEHLYVFQRTPSAIGERGNRPTDPDFAQEPRTGLAAVPHGQLPGSHDGPARPKSTWSTTGGRMTTPPSVPSCPKA